VFGADHHEYKLYPCVPEDELEQVERWRGLVFPEQLRAFYLKVGDGIAGPHYGLREANAVEGYGARAPYTDSTTLRALAREGEQTSRTDDYFEIEREKLTGLVTIIDEGCGHETCLVTTGSRTGEVVRVSLEGYVYETNRTLVQFYEDWLDRELERFQVVEGFMKSRLTLDEINKQVRDQVDMIDAGDIIASIANAEKPVELFGTVHHKIYHGASQTPWYEEVLREWRKTNNI
jgi:hypothetical protein